MKKSHTNNIQYEKGKIATNKRLKWELRRYHEPDENKLKFVEEQISKIYHTVNQLYSNKKINLKSK